MATPSVVRLTALTLALLIAAPPVDVAAQGVNFFLVHGGMSWPEAIKAAAADLDKVKPGGTGGAGNLGFGWNKKFNPKYWKQVDAANARYGLVSPDINAAEAVYDVLKNPKEYEIECATALKFILHLALIRHVGSGRYNEEAKKNPLEIGAKEYESFLRKVMVRGYGRSADYAEFPGMASWDCDPKPECDETADYRNDDEFVFGKKGGKDKLEVGDGVYIVNLRTSNTAYQGENTVYVGDGKGFGYPFGLKTIREIKDGLMTHWIRTPGKSQVAGIPNGPPGFVKDYYRADPNELRNLGNWVTTK